MQNENTETKANKTIRHSSLEVGRELLAKPQVLGDLLECEGFPPTLIFCNNPSDTDFVEVMLRKRGISAQKLIGNVQPPKLEKAIEDLRAGVLTALVVTDIAARNLDYSPLELIINYSATNDADIYHDRSGRGKETAHVRRVISLLNPLDLANFLLIKKNAGVDFEEEKLPSTEQAQGARARTIARQAEQANLLQDERMKAMVEAVKAEGNLEQTLAYLLNNTISVLPSLQAAQASRAAEEDDYFEDDSVEDPRARGGGRDRGNRGGGRDRNDRNDRGNDRNNRNDRNDRGGRGGSGGDARGARGGRNQRDGGGGARQSRHAGYDDDNNNERNDSDYGDSDNRSDNREYSDRDDSYQGGDRRGGGRRDSRRGDRGGDRGERGERGDRGGRNGDRQRRQNPPQKKDARIYIGAGLDQGLSREKLSKILTDDCGIAADEVAHMSVRGCYAFADIPLENESDVLEKLAGHEIGGKKLLATKGVVVTSQRPQPQREEGEGEENGSGFEHDSDGDDFDRNDDRNGFEEEAEF